jgi:hypothetical protein
MKKLLAGIIIFLSVAMAAALTGCKSGEGIMQCPTLSSAPKHHPVLLSKNQPLKSAKQADAQASVNKPKPTGLIASVEKGIPVSIKLPNVLKADGNDIDSVNKVLAQYSNNKVSIQQKANGKTYLTAGSLKDLMRLTSNLSKSMIHPRGYYEQRYGEGNGGIAVAGGILGLIAFIFAFIPFLDFLAIPLGIVAIILGAIGLRSHRRHFAIGGIVFGILALIIAPLTIFLLFWHFFLIP